MLHRTPYSLKKRLFSILMISSLIPLVLIGSISYISIFSLTNNNIESGIQNNLNQIRVSLENTIHSLESASLQLAVDNVRITNKIEDYRSTSDLMYKYNLKKDINDRIALMNTIGPDLGIISFYSSDKEEIVFKNQNIDPEFNLQNMPFLAEGINYNLFGPHDSASQSIDQSVFSIERKVYLVDEADFYVYVEIGLRLFEDMLSSQQYDLKVSHVLVSNTGKVVYSQIENGFPIGMQINKDKLSNIEKTDEVKNDYYVFTEKGRQGWYITAAISKKDYNYVINKWVISFTLIASLSIFISALLAYFIWKIVYKPLKRINGDIGLMVQSQFNTQIKMTGIEEFDIVLERFQDMKIKILDLFKEIEEKERKKRVVEVQNLLHQINPHFLHNTLNTIQWLARMNGQDEIDRFVALFARVLHYNLGKEGGIVFFSEEIEALKDYIDLHRFRYDYQFDVEMNIDPMLMEVKVPRFIMQPIVENALYHGLKCEDGIIRIEAKKDKGFLFITVVDNGQGMTEKDIQALFKNQTDGDKKSGMGIGLSYVKYILDIYYGEEALLEVESKLGTGTGFSIQLPIS